MQSLNHTLTVNRGSYVANASFPTSTGLIKLALLFQYLRVYDKKSQFRKAAIASVVLVTAWCLVYSVLTWVPTVPVSAYWNLSVPASRYAFGSIYADPFVAAYTSLIASNMILDIIVLGLAVPLLLYKKTGNERSRGALICLFTFGSMCVLFHHLCFQPATYQDLFADARCRASVFSIWRLAAIIKSRCTTYPTFDPTWYGPTPIVLAALEVDSKNPPATGTPLDYVEYFKKTVSGGLDGTFLISFLKSLLCTPWIMFHLPF